MGLEARNLTKFFNQKCAVNEVSFEIQPGEVIGLLGPNGAGKTTTFQLMVGLLYADQGQIFLDGKDITKRPIFERARLGLSYLAQEPSVFRGLSVEENILIALESAFRLDKVTKQKKLESLLREFHIESIRKSKGATLSGGERRRVEIARSLAINPSYLLLDEPFAGIDPIAVEEIQDIILQLREKKVGILITDHNARETLHICERGYILRGGKVQKAGTSEEIRKSPEVRRTYLGRRF